MNGLLVRVGIDSTDGGWNAPVLSATGDFAYVTITEEKSLRAGQARLYDEFKPAVQRILRFTTGAPGATAHPS